MKGSKSLKTFQAKVTKHIRKTLEIGIVQLKLPQTKIHATIQPSRLTSSAR